MKAGLGLGIAALALLVSGCGDKKSDSASASTGNAIAPIPAPNGGDWTQVVSETSDGGYRMGNPDAPVKLVEYASYSCPHCAEFSAEGADLLTNQYVKSGRVSWEYRPFILFGGDPGVALLVHCHGAQASFLLTHQLYDQQREWSGKLQELPQEQLQAMQNLPPQQQIPALIKVTGLDQFFRQRGMPQSKIDSCLADQKQLDRLMEITRTASAKYNVTGTPTFFINGNKVPDAASWGALQPALNAALQS